MEIILLTLWTLTLIVWALVNCWCLFVMAFLIFDAMVLYPMEQREFGRSELKKTIKSKTLDIYAHQYGFQRKTYLGLIKESDESLKKRMMNSNVGKRV